MLVGPPSDFGQMSPSPLSLPTRTFPELAPQMRPAHAHASTVGQQCARARSEEGRCGACAPSRAAHMEAREAQSCFVPREALTSALLLSRLALSWDRKALALPPPRNDGTVASTKASSWFRHRSRSSAEWPPPLFPRGPEAVDGVVQASLWAGARVASRCSRSAQRHIVPQSAGPQAIEANTALGMRARCAIRRQWRAGSETTERGARALRQDDPTTVGSS